MCGIAGIMNIGSSSRAITPELLERMRDTMSHRGPDDSGIWIGQGGSIGLAHRRLSIIDLSADGRQPLSNEDASLWITFNGEIYNFLDLRPGLEQRGHRFRSRTDTEVILHLFEESGEDSVRSLDGMFAVGIWDERRERLFLARDRLGVKPLYYTLQNGMLIFASEIKAILEHPAVSRDIDVEALYHYMTFRTTPAPLTMFAGIRKLPAGCFLTCGRDGNVRITPYWNPLETPVLHGHLNEEEIVATIQKLLGDAVQKRVIADVPTGVFLSGGLDSSAIVGLLAPRVNQPLNTFSIGISDLPGQNELEYARQIATQFGTNHREALIGHAELEAYLPSLVHHQDEPLADPVCVPLFYLSRLARESGVIVVQVGEGSDEQFLGYDSRIEFLESYQAKWARLLALPKPMIHGLHGAASFVNSITGVGGRLRRQLGKAARGDELFYGSVGFAEGAEKHLLFNGNPLFGGFSSETVVRENLHALRAARPNRDIAMEVSYLDMKVRLAELLLMRIDKVTMSVGVEAREPFLDYRLVEYLLALPMGLKLKNGTAKYLLKQAMKGILPENIVNRPKKAFAAPVNAWLRSGLESYARRVVEESQLRERNLLNYARIEQLFAEHMSGKADHGVQLWILMNLSAWYDHWIAGQLVS